jgi:hypothetical protein
VPEGAAAVVTGRGLRDTLHRIVTHWTLVCPLFHPTLGRHLWSANPSLRRASNANARQAAPSILRGDERETQATPSDQCADRRDPRGFCLASTRRDARMHCECQQFAVPDTNPES